MSTVEVDGLVQKVTGVAIGHRTDRPSCCEGYDGMDGKLRIREHLLDECDIITGEIEEFEGTLLDVLQCAVAEGGYFANIDIHGLTASEAAALLSDPRYIEAATDIASMDGDLNINGAAYELRDGVFVEYDG
ncbi:hypothetical protein [Rhabdothermincola salaria]|uniref:hypothetical protein n=1 Tax=Rhabdothermincola salaria TaxID=2903142 RepID=UPI001E3B319E|nr:hypothetical protein [Rhabdothermincola salaria]MCD9624199.1 hypothetical protein [Rhabdothermincola salaria]